MKKRQYALVIVLLGVAFLLLANHHWSQLGVDTSWQTPFNLLSFLYMTGLLMMAYTNKPFTYRKTNKLKVSVVIPLYNEDPETFRQVLASLDAQTLAPFMIYIVDDASTSLACKHIYNQWHNQTKLAHRYIRRRQNAGKREAQAVAFKIDKESDVFATIDSDTVLDKNALKNGLRPFGDEKVMTVAGLLVGLNYNKNLLTRLTDLGFVGSFVNGRAAWSKIKSVTVNCGGLAFYRSWVVRKHLKEYITQTVFGRKVSSGDDRILTDLALLEGWGVFQETSLGYTILPEKMSHLLRQRIRWWRSFFWGGFWLIRRFTPSRAAWWIVVWQFTSFTFYTTILVTLLISVSQTGAIPWGFIVYLTVIMSYLRSARYLLLDIPGRNKLSHYIIVALAPLSSLLHFLLCSVLQYVGLATVHVTGWGTRKKVEVSL